MTLIEIFKVAVLKVLKVQIPFAWLSVPECLKIGDL